MRQVHAAALHRRPDLGGRWPDSAGRSRPRPTEPAETRNRHGVPKLCAVPEHDRGAERRLRFTHAEGQRRRQPKTRRRSAETGRTQ
ncbi:hypothetical protein EMIT0180MI3_360026 [Priestia megaterium]